MPSYCAFFVSLVEFLNRFDRDCLVEGKGKLLEIFSVKDEEVLIDVHSDELAYHSVHFD